jgi:hypothetical protein
LRLPCTRTSHDEEWPFAVCDGGVLLVV